MLCPTVSWGQYPSEMVGFNNAPLGDPGDSDCFEMFWNPAWSGSTKWAIVPNSEGSYDLNSAFRSDAMYTEGLGSLQVFFSWVNPSDPDAWVRLTTYNHTVRPNPGLDTTGKVRFKLTNRGQFIVGEIGICLGIRETGEFVAQMADGGNSGPVEWVGVDPTVNGIIAGSNGIVETTASGDDVQEYAVGYDIVSNGLPAGTAVISPGSNGTIDTVPAGDDELRFGYFISTNGTRVPVPVITLPVRATAYALEWDLSTGDVTVDGGAPIDGAVAGFTGNGVLDAPNDRGTLEALVITNVVSDSAIKIDFAIDELQFEANSPDPIEPPVIVAPVYDTSTQVVVECHEAASSVALMINGTTNGIQTTIDDGTATFTGVSLSVGDALTATQIVYGVKSDPSSTLVVYGEGTLLADNFDSYASQEEMEELWLQTDPGNANKYELRTGDASSCDNQVLTDSTLGTAGSRLYRSIGTLNGTDEEPLVVTYRFKHDSNYTEARTRFELAPSLTRTYGAVGFAFTNGVYLPKYREQYLSMTNSPTPIFGYAYDYFYYDYALTGIDRVPGVWHEMKIEVKTSVVNFYVDGALANPVDSNGLPISSNGVPLYTDGVPRTDPNTSYKYVVLGCGYKCNAPAIRYDDISVTLGDTPIPFGDPNPVSSPTVVGPLYPGVTTVDIEDIDSNAVTVEVFADGVPVGSATGPFTGNIATVTVTALNNADSIAATQTVGGIESCLSAGVEVAVPTVTVQSFLVPGMAAVEVSDVLVGYATDINVYNDLGEGAVEYLGTLSNPTSSTVSVPVTPLINGATVIAKQVIATVEGPASGGVLVDLPAPTVLAPVVPLVNQVTVYDLLDGTGATASTVSVYVDDVFAASAPAGTRAVTVPMPSALQEGEMVTATQTVNGLESPKSEAVLVEFAEPPVTVNWKETSSLPDTGLTSHAAVVLNGYVYCIGGRTPTASQAADPVYYAPINSDGSIGAWQETTDLPLPLAAHGATAVNGRIYVWGGWSDGGYPTKNECYYITPNPDGSLPAAWTTSSVTIPDGEGQVQMDAFGRGMLAFNDTLYIINGERNNGTNSDQCYYSRLTAGGDYGSWQTTSSTPDASWFHGVAIIEGTTEDYLFRVAGNYRGTNENGMWRTTVNADGSLGSWERDPADTPQARYEHMCAVVDNEYIFMIGGLNGLTPQSTVYYTKVNHDTGEVSGWMTGNSYPIPIARSTAVSYEVGGKNYLLGVSGGGYYSTGSQDARCWYTEIAVDTDGDGVGDADDACPGTIPGGLVSADGCDAFDYDTDGDVDLADYSVFQGCFNATGLTAPCLRGDSNADDVVDMEDFVDFESVFTGPK